MSTSTTPDIGQDQEVSIIDRVKVIHNYVPNKPTKLQLGKGDIVAVIVKNSNGWYAGFKIGNPDLQIGWFPSSYVQSIETDILPEANPLTWDSLIKDIVVAITALKQATVKKEISNYMQLARGVIDACSVMFDACEASSKKTVGEVANNKSSLLGALTTMVNVSKIALVDKGVVDNEVKMKQGCGLVLLALRKFVETCVAQDIRLDQTVQRKPVQSANTLQPLDVDEAQLHNALEEFSIQIKDVLSSLMDHIGSDGDTLKGPQLQEVSDNVVKICTQVGSFIDDSRLDETPKTIPNLSLREQSVRACRDNLNGSVTNLMNAVALAVDSFAPEHATRNALLCITVTMKHLKDLMVAVKQAADNKKLAHLQHVEQEVNELLNIIKLWDGGKHADPSLAKVTERTDEDDNNDGDESELDQTDVKWRTTSHQVINMPPRKVSIASTKSMQPLKNQKQIASTKKVQKFFGVDGPSSGSIEAVKSPDVQRRKSQVMDSTLVDDQESSGVSRKMKKFFGEDIQPESIPSIQESMVPHYLQQDFQPSELIFNMDGDSKVKAGTLFALVAHLVSHENPHFSFTVSFLITFRLFLTPIKLVEMLQCRFLISPPANLTDLEMVQWHEKKRRVVQIRVYKVIKYWLEDYWYHKEDASALQVLQTFVKAHLYHSLPKETDKLLELIDKRLSLLKVDMPAEDVQVKTGYVDYFPPPPIIPKISKVLQLDDIDVEEMARQLTLIEHKLFVDIHPIEMLYYRPDDKRQFVAAQAVKAMIKEANLVAGWVAGLILMEKDVKRRANIIKYFLKTAEKCYEMKNFATREAIMAAINSTPIYRLKRTWDELGPKSKARFEQQIKFMDRDSNFSTYRNALKSTIPPCIPFLGLYLTDMTFIMQGNSDTINRSSMINFDKYQKVAAVVEDLKRFQNGNYLFEEVQSIQAYIKTSLQLSRDVSDMHELSLQLEPRESTTLQRPSAKKPDEEGASLKLQLERLQEDMTK